MAFGDKDRDLHRRLQPLSSLDLRGLLGCQTFRELKAAADTERLSVNAYCLRKLHMELGPTVEEPGQMYLTELYVDPLHATFRGGHEEPMHEWYPLPEGYSPAFVRKILEEFAPGALRVFDPFAGTGTTPLTAAQMGLDSFYCEINPLFQHLIKVKTDALTMKDRARDRVLNLLSEWAAKVDRWLEDGPVDQRLALAYAAAFGRSAFFAPETFSQVLRARTLVDDLACVYPLAADFLAVAVLASLIPASLLKRSGDLRYRTEDELRSGTTPLAEGVKRQLARIVSDLSTLGNVDRRPLLVCEDAKRLGTLPPYGFDCVVTSPPYLNGTNYCRNSRLEMWFLRCLADKSELTRFREREVTAGINAVQPLKAQLLDHPEVAQVVERLGAEAYDPRIPRMVGSYFFDLATVVEGMVRHLVPGACVAMDIGDSSYGGIRVPTDEILERLLLDRGMKRLTRVDLRKRLSRDGTPLRQVLLVFAYEQRPGTPPAAVGEAPWARRWEDFKMSLPHQKQPFAKRNWGHPLHSLCSYQGKMKPSLAHHLLRSFVSSPATILDPFAGVGTIPFEAGLLGVRGFGFEISPAAYVIAAGKCGAPEPAKCAELIDSLADFIGQGEPTEGDAQSARDVAFNGRVEDFYEPRTLREVLLARRFFRERPPVSDEECFVVASLLHILHGNRPYALSRRSHNTTPFAPKGPFEYRALVPRLREKVARGLAVQRPACYQPGRIFLQDATSWWPQEVRDLDAVVTSPPFFDSTRFHLANWLRLWFCGWDRADFKSKPQMFLDERQKSTFAVYEPVFRQARERLKPGGVVVLHLGRSAKCDMAAEVARIASKWFQVADAFDESVRHCESHGVRDKGAVADHQYLVLT